MEYVYLPLQSLMKLLPQEAPQWLTVAATFLLVIPFAAITLLFTSPPTLLFYLLAVFATSAICPLWLTKLQKLKK